MSTPASTLADAGPLVVLIVDEDADTRDMYRYYLSRSGLVVKESCNGLDAIEQAKQLLPDVIVAELVLPGVDGFRFGAEIRRHQPTAAIPLVALTGYARADAAEEARRIGFDLVLLKPCLPDHLLSEILRIGDPGRA